MKNALLHHGGSKNTIFDHKSQTDIPLTKKALVDAALQGGKGTSASDKKNSPYKVEVLEPKPMPLTKYGTKAIPMPTAKDEIYQLVAKLPDHFPFDEWDEMHPDAQREQIMKTKLTAEEQLVFLNADLPIGTLKEIQEIENNNDYVWRTKAEKDFFLERIWEAGSAIYAISNHQHPLSYDRSAEKYLIELIHNDTDRIKESVDEDVTDMYKSLDYSPYRSQTGTETLLGSYEGTLLDHQKEGKQETITLKERLGLYPRYRIDEYGNVEKNTVNILYTTSLGANFKRQANYQKRMLETAGYNVVMRKVNSVDEFTEAWDNMDDSTKAVLVFSHSNGNALMFEANTHTNAMSWNGKNADK